jgi:3-hydroxyisobutyrate dehydrogenase
MGVPMRLIDQTVAEMTKALGRGWEDRDSRVSMLLQQERAGLDFAVDPKDAQAVIDAD